jgi:hypothetical protein
VAAGLSAASLLSCRFYARGQSRFPSGAQFRQSRAVQQRWADEADDGTPDVPGTPRGDPSPRTLQGACAAGDPAKEGQWHRRPTKTW